jgi:serine/threonine protein kinase
MSRRCGTAGFVAPEVLDPDWPEHLQGATVATVTKIDAFSFGILIYTAIFGNNPFMNGTSTSTSTLRRNVRASLVPAIMASRSDELQYLLYGLCAKNPHQRFSTSEALAAPWLSADRPKVAWAALEAAARGLL